MQTNYLRRRSGYAKLFSKPRKEKYGKPVAVMQAHESKDENPAECAPGSMSGVSTCPRSWQGGQLGRTLVQTGGFAVGTQGEEPGTGLVVANYLVL